jgi:hypothetical protein
MQENVYINIIETVEYDSQKMFVYFHDHSLASIYNLTSNASNAFLVVSCFFNVLILKHPSVFWFCGYLSFMDMYNNVLRTCYLSFQFLALTAVN